MIIDDKIRETTDEELTQFICVGSGFCDVYEHNQENTCCYENFLS